MTNSHTLYDEYLREVAFKEQLDATTVTHSHDVLNELFLCKINKVDPDMLINCKLTVTNIQYIRDVVKRVQANYGRK